MKVPLSEIVSFHRQPRLVLDVGGYKGDYTNCILERFDTRVILFEPNKYFADFCRERFEGKNVEVMDLAIGKEKGERTLYKARISSTLFPELTRSRDTVVVPVDRLSNYMSDRVDIVKLNCEGAEYEILRDLEETGWLDKIPEVLVQFHKITDFGEEYRRFHQVLAKNRKLVYTKKWGLWQREF